MKLVFALSGFCLISPLASWAVTPNACDLNLDGVVNTTDVQLASNMVKGLAPCAANIAGLGVCNSVVLDRVTLAAAGSTCVVGDAHSVSLAWTASTSSNLAGYNVYRGLNSSGPYTKLTATPVAATSYTDDGVPSGQTFYYATTAVDKNNNESAYSNVAQGAIPHSVAMTWTSSVSPNLTGYHIYRSLTPGGPYARLTLSPVAATGFTDYAPMPGLIYYYVVTAVDAYGSESTQSLEALAVLPFH